MRHPQGAPTASAYIGCAPKPFLLRGQHVNGFCGLFNARVRTTLSLRLGGRSVGRNKPAVRGSTGCTLNLDESKRSNSKNKPELNDLPSFLNVWQDYSTSCKPLKFKPLQRQIQPGVIQSRTSHVIRFKSASNHTRFNQPLPQERFADSLPAYVHRSRPPLQACLHCRIALAAVLLPPAPALLPARAQMYGRSRPV